MTWIEQLAEKKRSVGASMTLAVSSVGFSAPAIKKASTVGIEIRTLDEMNAEDFRDWLAVQHVVLDVREWSLAELALELFDAPQNAKLSLASQVSFREKGHLAPIFIRNLDNKQYHVENFLNEWGKHNGSFFPDDLSTDGTRIQRNLHQPIDRNLVHVETTQGNFDVRIIHIGLWLSRSKALVPVSRLVEYSDPSSPLVQTAEWDLESARNEVQVAWIPDGRGNLRRTGLALLHEKKRAKGKCINAGAIETPNGPAWIGDERFTKKIE